MKVNGNEVFAIAFDKGRPFTLLTTGERDANGLVRYCHYHASEYSKAFDALLVHCHGSGPFRHDLTDLHDLIRAEFRVWIDPTATTYDVQAIPRLLTRIPKRWNTEEFGNDRRPDSPSVWIDQNSVYCSVCNDWFPDEEWNVCQHLYWCDEHGCWAGEGSTDGCKCVALESGSEV